MILLSSGSESQYPYLDTNGIIGNSDSNQKKIIPDLQRLLAPGDGDLALRKLQGIVYVEEPNKDFARFKGKIKLHGFPKALEIGIEQALFRGGVIGGVPWVIGLVAFAGHETKTLLNTKSPTRKTSEVEKKINKWVLFILLVLVGLNVFSILAYYYLSNDDYSQDSLVQIFITFTLLYNNIIPISLFVSMDIIRVLQVIYIQYSMNKKIGFKTGDINENLGQIEYVVVDKSGTITENEYILQCISVEDEQYVRYHNYERSYSNADEDKPLFHNLNNKDSTFQLADSLEVQHIVPVENNLEKLRRKALAQKEGIKWKLLKCMTLCNSVVPSGDQYHGPLAEEIALVTAAEELGFKLILRSIELCEIEINGIKEEFTILGAKASKADQLKTRIITKQKDQNAVLLVKGSYESIVPLLHNETIKIQISNEATRISLEGQRPLLFAMKTLKSHEIIDFFTKLDIAKRSPLNVDGKIENVYAELEKNLDFLGIAGIEDRILPETIECIEALQASGMKVFMVSGDSENSTLASANGSKLFSQDLSIVHINKIDNEFACIKRLQKVISSKVFHDVGIENISKSPSHIDYASYDPFVKEMNSMKPDESIVSEYLEEASMLKDKLRSKTKGLSLHPLMTLESKCMLNFTLMNRPFYPGSLKFGLSIDRMSFRTALSTEDTRKLLVCLLVTAQTACFSDMLPQDKADLVLLLKENIIYKPLVLAIGSSNSDIAMIQEADVGIGIKGKEDNHAKNFCEIAISHFALLKELILVHGHWNYSRMSRAILLYFYKNFILTVITFGYVFISDFSGTSIFNSGLLVGYNLLYTTFPLIVLGVFDQDISDSKNADLKLLYSQGIKNSLFNYKVLFYYSMHSIIQGGILFLWVTEAELDLTNEEGMTGNFDVFGCALFIATVITVLLHIVIETYSFSIVYVCSHFLSLTFLACYLIICTDQPFPNYELIGIGDILSKSSIALVIILVTPLVSIVPHYAIRLYLSIFRSGFREKVWAVEAKNATCKCIYERLEQFSNCLLSVYRNSTHWKSKGEKNGFDMNNLLKFQSPYVEKVYRDHYISDNIAMYRTICTFIWVILILWTIFESIFLNVSMDYTIIRIALALGFTIVLLIILLEHFKKHYVQYTLTIICVGLFAMHCTNIGYQQIGPLSAAIVPAITYILFNVDWVKITHLNIINVILFAISLIYYCYGNHQKYSGALETIFIAFIPFILVVSITLTSSFIGYNLERSRRYEHKLMNIAENGVEKIQTILSYLLPAFVRNRVKKGVRYIAEDQGTVTVLFCDIYDFDRICKEYSPIELTTFLDALFQRFDQLCDVVGVTKIETVNKTYMACAGLKDSEAEMSESLKEVSHARRCIEMGLSIIKDISSIKLKYGPNLEVKIGINTGPVTAGVVGYHKPQFSLVGDTVNTASRMCSTLEKTNTIQISTDTYKMLESRKGLDFIFNKVEAKGKGLLDTYFVSEAKTSRDIEEINMKESPIFVRKQSLINGYLDTTQSEDPKASTSKSIFSHFDMTKAMDVFQRKETEMIQNIKLFNLQCKETGNQKKFRKNKAKANYWLVLIGHIIAFFNFGLLLLISVIEYYYVSNLTDGLIVIFRIAEVGCLAILLVFHKFIHWLRIYPLFTLSVLALMLIIDLFYLIYSNDVPNDYVALELLYIILILNHASNMPVSIIIWADIMIFIPWLIFAFLDSGTTLIAANSVIIIGFIIINLYAAYSRELRLRINFNLQHLAQKEIDETNKLLVQMMPPHVLENMKQDKSITDKLNDVTLLFADIVGFTAWSSNKTPKKVVKMLSELFTQFDKKCVELNVYKVHTIGDCYVVMGYNGNENRNIGEECVNMLKMAQEMIKIINEINRLHSSNLNMRIGLHTGEVIAGIIGTNIVRYDIYGPDVLIANKMESGGQPGMINVSDVTKAILEEKEPGRYEFNFNKEISAKSIGRSHMSFFTIDTEQPTS
ncbi:unnamed protein product [Blepharisma stoltei]|uniref:Guanylate cyclase domain-containing protein n=1 Tax=Blepharisma stoltei TaxID=1481888 RepID=A0AAU9ILJ8_9CILI|nr:unnamed protein product [Blepharisma stoltei]